jgi:hypothetical protein
MGRKRCLAPPASGKPLRFCAPAEQKITNKREFDKKKKVRELRE